MRRAPSKTFMGRPCKKGHVERFEKTRLCVACSRDRGARWRANNPDMVVEHRKKFYPRMKALHKEWRDENPEKVRAYSAATRRRYPEKMLEQGRMWRKNNPEKSRALVRNRRARLRGADGSHSPDDIAEIREMQGGKCAYCRIRLNSVVEHVDHIKPVSKGGSNSRKNLQILCGSCNSSKHDADPVDFARRTGRLI